MKKILFVLIICSFILTGCNKECQPWYEGKRCDVEMRDKFYGVFTGTLTGAGQSQTVTTTLTPHSSGEQRMYVDGVAYVDLTGSTTFEYPSQTIIDPTNGNWTINSGNGAIQDDQLTYNFYATIQGQAFNFGFVGNR